MVGVHNISGVGLCTFGFHKEGQMFNIQSVKNLFWANEEQTVFECTVKYAEFQDEVPVGVNSIDPYPHIKELWEKGNAGAYGLIAPYVAPAAPQESPQKDQPTTQGAQAF